ncbi:hypothetical protein DK847_05375 [Aestuariivirga litoralis]|uniref:Uncharacterized protein n=1 Tax=Aestuariivirga litoralis TaxID=2650924 RepID=A0A2W2BCF0_9HYPH|nr:hypothetical protein [Aestuariivirga litoralis]PZF77858.1 hypothetical protein DK847_05375 [Aestuariivirga litoralis]
MARLMWICGILLIAAGVALGVVLLVSAARPGGMDIQTAAILLVGGILSLGLGGVIDALQARPAVRSIIPEPVIPAATAPIPEFDPRSAKAAVAAASVAATTVATASVIVEEEVSRPTRDTIQALEQARQKIEQAFESRSEAPKQPTAATEEDIEAGAGIEADAESTAETETDIEAAEAAPEAVIEEETVTEDEEVMDDGQLYVVEERVIRRHPARILSDGTVEAETAEGWMRFENLEHLDEYLDAMEPARS